jgi:hypothetical protein
MVRFKFESDETSVGRQSASKPDGAIASKRANFQNSTRTLDFGEELQEASLTGGDLDWRQTGKGAGLERGFQDRIGWQKRPREELIDLNPMLLVWVRHGDILAHSVYDAPTNLGLSPGLEEI